MYICKKLKKNDLVDSKIRAIGLNLSLVTKGIDSNK